MRVVDPARTILLAASLAMGLGCSAEGCGTRGEGGGPSRVDPADLPARSTVYLVRELPAATSEDGPLSRLSQATALGLPQEIDLRALDAIYISDSERAKETASVVTMVRGIEAQVIDTQSQGAMRGVLDEHRGGTILVVAPARDLVGIGDLVGLKRPLRFGNNDYGELVELRTDGSKTKVKRKAFGKTLRNKVESGRFGDGPQDDASASAGSTGSSSTGPSSTGPSSTGGDEASE